MKMIFACIWESSASQEDFEIRVPKLMDWLNQLHKENKLRGCGGCEDETIGGLTLIESESIEEVRKICSSYPMNDIGTLKIVPWQVYHADLEVSGKWNGWWEQTPSP